MMTRKFKGSVLPRKIIFSIFLIFAACFSVSAADWIVAAQKFELTRGQTDSVSNALATMIPSRILDNFGTNNFRTILKSEQNDREVYDLKKSQNSLFLQLSSEIKKRDSLVLGNYTKKELEEKIAEEDKKIKDIQKQILENVERRKELESMEEIARESDSKSAGPSPSTGSNLPSGSNSTSKPASVTDSETSERDKFTAFVRTFFEEEQEQAVIEKISFYRNDASFLFTPSENAKNKDFLSFEYEKEMISASIQALITGKITIYGEYMAVAVEVYSYPNAKLIAATTEVGTVADVDFICSSIARELVPPLTNAMPVSIVFSISPSNSKLYIDDVLQPELPQKLVLDSGVHSVLVEAEGYKNAGTSYFFNGNNVYNIEINLAQDMPGTVLFELADIPGGSLYANGLSYQKEESVPSEIKVNGENVLGQFITEDGMNAFIYIDKNDAVSGKKLFAKPKLLSRTEYIEKRRRWMYTSYSVLIVSLIPYFYTKGLSESYVNAQASGATLDSQALAQANMWSMASAITGGISIAAGGWFIYDLVRYLMSADSVLPYEAHEVE
ncbi:MAG: PEGA domain-containing protein [Treponema sp.]|nr:PEGA domain-containing protein [Treponema sp.]